MSRKLMMNNQSELDCDFYLRNKSFNGVSDYIDTGLNLFDTITDWCIYINFTDLGVTSNQWIHILHNMTENGDYPGMTLSKTPQSMLEFTGRFFEFRNIVNLNTISNIKIVIFRRVSKIGYKIMNGDITEKTYPFTSTDKNLLIGCYQTLGGVKGRYWKGIVHELIVYKNKTITDQEIEGLLQRGE